MVETPDELPCFDDLHFPCRDTMSPGLFEDRAALYVSGAMTARERENFNLILEFHEELRIRVARLREAMSELAFASAPPAPMPSEELKARILASLDVTPHKTEPEALVVTNPAGRVVWISPAFTDMCGFTLNELKGRKPGHLLQGEATDLSTVERIRVALRQKRPCRETLVNYHKDGSDYVVDIRIVPILDDHGEPLWFIAKERKLQEHEARLLGK
jgi:PAS domain S-box-containing protein